MEILIYSRENCLNCEIAKKTLKANKIGFKDELITDEIIKKYNVKSVPLILLNGSESTVGQILREYIDNQPLTPLPVDF